MCWTEGAITYPLGIAHGLCVSEALIVLWFLLKPLFKMLGHLGSGSFRLYEGESHNHDYAVGCSRCFGDSRMEPMPSYAASRDASRALRTNVQSVESCQGTLHSASRRSSLTPTSASNIYVTLVGAVGAERSGGNASVYVAFESRSALNPGEVVRRDEIAALRVRGYVTRRQRCPQTATRETSCTRSGTGYPQPWQFAMRVTSLE